MAQNLDAHFSMNFTEHFLTLILHFPSTNVFVLA